MQRKAISPFNFADLADLATRILDFQDRYNATSEPFDRRYTRDDLSDLLTRIAA